MVEKNIILNTGRHPSEIYIGDWRPRLTKLTENLDAIYLTDENVFSHYKDFLKEQRTIVVPPGEESKTLLSSQNIFRQLIDLEADRSSWLIGFGGGVVTDIAGFVASTYMRGMNFGFVSTSLLGQVDAVIGGKNGVNLDGYKNMIGTFNQPRFIINDPTFFKTLPEKEFINGTAEVIKQFLIADEEALLWFDQNLNQYFKKNTEILSDLIYRQNMIKKEVVEKDERETGIRKILNFGHSFGHAIEKEHKWPHGHAVAVGMVIAILLSELEGLISTSDAKKYIDLIAKCKLPHQYHFELQPLIQTMMKDKKKKGKSIDFILLEKPGKAFIKNFDFNILAQHLAKINL